MRENGSRRRSATLPIINLISLIAGPYRWPKWLFGMVLSATVFSRGSSGHPDQAWSGVCGCLLRNVFSGKDLFMAGSEQSDKVSPTPWPRLESGSTEAGRMVLLSRLHSRLHSICCGESRQIARDHGGGTDGVMVRGAISDESITTSWGTPTTCVKYHTSSTRARRKLGPGGGEDDLERVREMASAMASRLSKPSPASV